MPESRDIVAVIFDFDGTLVPDSITGLLRKHSIDPKKFWMQDAQRLVKEGYDPVHAYLNLLLRNIGTDKPLGKLTSADLRRFGSTLDKFYYPGIPRIFQDLQRKAKPYGVDVEYYIVSSGLQEIIEGSRITKEYFKAVYGSRLAGDNDKGMLKYIKRCITYTEKTRYLFEINKGISPSESHRDFVNEEIPMEKRRIPFSNMVYVGDGLTDIPCFSLVKTGVRNLPGGRAFGVFDPTDERSARRALMKILLPNRVESAHKAMYRPSDELGSFIRAAVATICADIDLRRGDPYRKAP